MATAFAVHPHQLSYVNEIAGGPRNAFRHLANSDVDWGQDLLYLRQWLNDHPEVSSLRLAYFGAIDPRVLDIQHSLPVAYDEVESSWPGKQRAEVQRALLEPGWYALSINCLCGLPLRTLDENGKEKGFADGAFTYFQRCTPVATAGYSIFIYHITPEESARLRREFGLLPLTINET